MALPKGFVPVAGTENNQVVPKPPRGFVVQTNLLDRTGVTAEEVKRRAAAGQSPDERMFVEPTPYEAAASSTSALVSGMGRGLASLLTVPADLAMAMVDPLQQERRRARGEPEAQEMFGVPIPRTQLANEAAEDARRTFDQWLGVRPNIVNDVGVTANDLVGEAIVPGPEVAIEIRNAMKPSLPKPHANELTIRPRAETPPAIPPANENAARLLEPEAAPAPSDVEVSEMVARAGRAQERAANPPAPEQPRDFVDMELARRQEAQAALDAAVEPRAPQGPFGDAPPVTPDDAGGAIPPVAPNAPAQSADPVEKVLAALRKAKPLRKEQEAIYTATRTDRMRDALSLRQAGQTGEAGFAAERGALSGKMDKVDFDELRSQLGQEDIDALFVRAADHPDLKFFETVNVRDGLRRMLDGQLPQENQLKLLRKVYGDDLANELLDQRSTFAKMKETGLQIANIPRALMSSFDLSAPFRQGVFFVSRPRQFFPAFKKMFSAYGSEAGYEAVENSIRNSPNFELMHDSGLAITDLEGLASREEAFATSLAEKMPVVEGSGALRTPARVAAKTYNATLGRGVRASGRAYTAFLTKLRADVFDDLVSKAGMAGLDVEANGGQLGKQIAQFVNAGTGRGEVFDFLKGAQPALNAFFFSPKLMASRMTLLNPATYLRPPKFVYDVFGIPYDAGAAFVRKEAQKSVAGFAAFGTSMLGLAYAAGADVGTNPYSSDFGKIKVGDTRLDVWGGFQQYVRMLAQIGGKKYASATTGKEYTLGEGYKPTTRYDILMRQIESKEAPIFSFVTTMLKQQDWQGQPVSVRDEIVKRLTPMYLSSLVELAKEDPRLLPFGLAGLLGVGVQTFDTKPSSGPISSGSSGGGITSGIGPQSSLDKFGYDGAITELQGSIPQGSSPEVVTQAVSAATPVYVGPDGTRTTIPTSIRSAFAQNYATREDQTNTPIRKWLEAMAKQRKIKPGGQLVFETGGQATTASYYA